jgi:methionyl-tRNA formyltransferase
VGEGIPVGTGDGTYVVDEVQPAGGRRMTAAAWLRGRR